MPRNERDRTYGDTCLLALCDEPTAERMKIHKAASLAGTLIIDLEFQAVGPEAFAKDIAGITLIFKFIEQPVLRPFPFASPLNNLDKLRVHWDTSRGSTSFALLQVEA